MWHSYFLSKILDSVGIHDNRVKSEINDDMLLAGAQLDDDEDMDSPEASDSDGDAHARDRGKGAKAKIKPSGPMDDDSEEGEHNS